MHVDLFLPNRKRFVKVSVRGPHLSASHFFFTDTTNNAQSFNLYGPIDPAASTFTILGTKCEVALAKADGRSWPSITAIDALAGNFVAQLAFSAGGGRGTTGSKDMILDSTNTRS